RGGHVDGLSRNPRISRRCSPCVEIAGHRGMPSTSSGRRTRYLPTSISAFIAIGFMTIGVTACAIGRRPAAGRPSSSAPADGSSANGSAPAVPHTPWRPRHKGGVDLSTGLYTREDDDLVLDTPMPLVLHRTYNSGDGHPRQFGRDWTHAGEWWLH